MTQEKADKVSNIFSLSRTIFNDPLWEKSFHKKGKKKICSDFMAYVYIVGNANYEDKLMEIWGTGKSIIVERGQFFTSQLKLHNKFGWNRDKVRRFLNRHKNTLDIDTLTSKDHHNGYTIITIKNYDDFQFKPKKIPKTDSPFALDIDTTNKVNNSKSFKGKKSYPFIPKVLEDLPPEQRKKVEFI